MNRKFSSLVVAAAAFVAYLPSFQGVFVNDDKSAIVESPAIRSLAAALTETFPAGGGMTLAGRPFTQFTFALNYAAHGLALWGYHLVNLAIHVIAALTLMALVAGTARQWKGEKAAERVGFAAALLWVLHPLNTESVTYIVQRAEALAALACLATLYFAMRGAVEGRGKLFYPLSALACLLGVLSKESAVVIPVAVLLFDRAFIAEGFSEALRARWKLYAALFASWLPLAVMIAGTGGRGNTVGPALSVSWWRYLLTQSEAITTYLRLTLWPHPLSLEYGTATVGTLGAVWPQALLIAALLAFSLLLWRRDAKTGFWALFFWLALAPTSSVVPIAHPIVEHRTYLPLVGVAVLAALAGNSLAGIGSKGAKSAAALLALASLVLGGFTYARNMDYRSLTGIWGKTVEASPGNPRARINYANALIEEAQFSESGREARRALLEAKGQIEEALKLDPEAVSARVAYGNLLEMIGQPQLAIGQYEAALSRDPARADVYNNLGVLYMRLGMVGEGAASFEEALRINPRFQPALENLEKARGIGGNLPK